VLYVKYAPAKDPPVAVKSTEYIVSALPMMLPEPVTVPEPVNVLFAGATIGILYHQF
jgi:hypothetical protein